jgi:hypothetical protein
MNWLLHSSRPASWHDRACLMVLRRPPALACLCMSLDIVPPCKYVQVLGQKAALHHSTCAASSRTTG